jgi:hypothetical protein
LFQVAYKQGDGSHPGGGGQDNAGFVFVSRESDYSAGSIELPLNDLEGKRGVSQ